MAAGKEKEPTPMPFDRHVATAYCCLIPHSTICERIVDVGTVKCQNIQKKVFGSLPRSQWNPVQVRTGAWHWRTRPRMRQDHHCEVQEADGSPLLPVAEEVRNNVQGMGSRVSEVEEMALHCRLRLPRVGRLIVATPYCLRQGFCIC